jgi:hypothetical protein
MAFDDKKRSTPETLEQLLDRLGEADNGCQQTSLGAIFETVGTRSFGPLLVVCGLLAISPLSGVPGVPTTIGILVVLIAAQLLIGRHHFWLPRWLLSRCVSHTIFDAALRRARLTTGCVAALGPVLM